MEIFKPKHFSAKGPKDELSFIKEFSFATIISVANGSIKHISKAPLLLKESEDCNYLEGHLANINSHLNYFEENNNVLIIFDGPHGYISPTWYQDPSNSIPTWNYTSVFVNGYMEVIKSQEWILTSLMELTDKYEHDSSWKENVDKEYLSNLSKGISGIQIKINSIESKFKLSQNKGSTDRDNIIKNLIENSSLSKLMEKI